MQKDHSNEAAMEDHSKGGCVRQQEEDTEQHNTSSKILGIQKRKNLLKKTVI